jgi:predicted methyltransferase
MAHTRRGALAVVLASLAAACTPVSPPGPGERADESTRPTPAELLADVLADPRRDADRARDAWRHPAETLTFFGIAPGMTVAEVDPGAGWYTRILVPYLGENGLYLGVGYSRLTYDRIAAGPALGARPTAPDVFTAELPARARSYAPEGAEILGAYVFDETPSTLYGTVDAVLFVRALHNLRRTGTLEGALAETYALVKPGGVIGVVQHRARPDADDRYANGEKGYLREADVIAAFEAAGFVLEERSEINANPNDPADWPNGVWTLPPELTLGLLNRERFEAIGESDRMTLRFRKPSSFPLGG